MFSRKTNGNGPSCHDAHKRHPGTRLARGVARMAVSVVLATFYATGCKSLTTQSIEDQQKMLRMWTDFARENGIEVMVQLDYRGRGGLYFEQLYGVDLGAGMHGIFMFRPQPNVQPLPTPVVPPSP